MDKNGLYGFMLSVITDMELQGRYSTAHVYHCALKSAVGYGGTSLRIEDLSPVWLHNYQEHLLRQALLWLFGDGSYAAFIFLIGKIRTDCGRHVPFLPHLISFLLFLLFANCLMVERPTVKSLQSLR